MQTKSDLETTVERLREQVSEHDRAYYREDAPTISDAEYDRIYAELVEAEKRLSESNSEVSNFESPTSRPGGAPIDGFAHVAHDVPMLSVDNTYSDEEVLAFDYRVFKSLAENTEIRYVVDYKVDGVAVSVVYSGPDGAFLRAVTRGDGSVGDDVTENVRTIGNLPKKLPLAAWGIDRLELRGEVYVSREDLESVNAERSASGEAPLANPRNAASGSLKLLDSSVCAKRRLSVVFHTMPSPPRGKLGELVWASQWNAFTELATRGIPVVSSSLVDGPTRLLETISAMGRNRSDLPFDVDGVVVKVNEFALRDTIGSGSRSPKWAVAYKYAAERVETSLKKISLQVGRTGAITPVAELEPVSIGGTVVSRATLHNADEIVRKDFRVGDRVLIERGGEVIPKVVSAIPEKRDGSQTPYVFPRECPSCGGPIWRPDGEAVYRCDCMRCPAQLKQRIEHWCSKRAMDIEGLGGAMVEKLVSTGLVSNVSDVYGLSKESLLSLDGVKDKSATKLLVAIEASKKKPVEKVLFALGIRHVGERVAEIVCEKFRDLAAIAAADAGEIAEISGIGEVVERSLGAFFADESNLAVVDSLEKAGLNLRVVDTGSTETVAEGLPDLSGLKFAVTGTLRSMKRDAAFEEIKKRGAVASSSVTKKTDYLVCGDDSGSKLQKARELGVEVVSETEFLEMLERGISDRSVF